MAKKKRKTTKRAPRKVGKINIEGRDVPVMQEPGGTGMVAIINGNTKDEVWRIVSEMQVFAMENGLEQIEIMSIQPSPAGGWEAVVRAHNFNPFKAMAGAAKKGWEGAKAAGEKAEEITAPVRTFTTGAARTVARGMTPGHWEAAKREFRADPGVVNKPTPDTRAEDEAVMAWIQGKKRKAKREREMTKYGIEAGTQPRETVYEVAELDQYGNPTGKKQQIKQKLGGKTFTTEEIERKIAKAKKGEGKPLRERAAGKAEEAIKGTTRFGMEATVQTARMAQRPMGVSAFQRGSGTFGPDRGMTPFIAAPSPAAQQRLMASTVMPGISPTSTGMRRLSPAATGVPSVVGVSAPSPVGGVRPLPPGAKAPSPVGGIAAMPLGFGRRDRKTRVPSVLPGQDWTDVR